jgi:parallel beta-helix repeat protein
MNRRTAIDMITLGIIATLLSGFRKASKITAYKPRHINFYIAKNGNDKWSGKLANPNSRKTDGPFATLERARSVIRTLKQQQRIASVVVLLRQGTYYLTETFTLNSQDSGLDRFPITYQAYPNERPIISGGKLISRWRTANINERQVWVADIPEAKSRGWEFRQLWSPKKRLIRTRHPSQGYFKLADSIDSIQPKSTHLKYEQGNLKNWKHIDRAEVVVMSLWREYRFPVSKIVESTGEVWSDKLPFERYDNGELRKGDLYYLEGCLETLDAVGEWFLDRQLGKLYYVPFPGENIARFKVIAPRLSQLIRLDGVKYVNFQDLTFSHTDWYYDTAYKYAAYAQAAQQINFIADDGGYAGGVPGTIHAKNSQFCQWNNCNFTHLGGYGIEIAQACTDIKIVDCQFSDLGAGGVILAKAQRNQIRNCQMNDLGIFFHSAVGIFVADSSENYIANNHIHHLYYSGISVGWVWGYGKNRSHHNIIDANYIHDLGITSFQASEPILNDKGAIYTLGIQPGTEIVNNRIHDIYSFNYGGWGIYLDEGSSEISVKNNLAYKTRDGGFHQNYGKDNIIQNNIFAYGKLAQMRRTRKENHNSFIFENNIIYWEQGKLWEGDFDDPASIQADKNLYWTTDRANIRFGKLSLQEWQAQGLDRHSLIADPQFLDPQHSDFRLKAGSPAFNLGFKSLPHKI